MKFNLTSDLNHFLNAKTRGCRKAKVIHLVGVVLRLAKLRGSLNVQDLIQMTPPTYFCSIGPPVIQIVIQNTEGNKMTSKQLDVLLIDLKKYRTCSHAPRSIEMRRGSAQRTLNRS